MQEQQYLFDKELVEINYLVIGEILIMPFQA